MAKLPWWMKNKKLKKEQDGFLYFTFTVTKLGKIYLFIRLLLVNPVLNCILNIKRKIA